MKTGKTTIRGTLAAILTLAFTACASDTAFTIAPSSGLDELSRAIRSVSDYLNETIPGGGLVVFMNVQSDFEQLSDFIIDELLANAVNDRVFTVVDRRQLDVIRAEQDLQLSGEVDDETALNVGRFLGAQVIVSGRIASLGGHYRLTIRALEVETARLQGQYNRNIGTVASIDMLMGDRRMVQAPVQDARQALAPQTVQVPGQQAAQTPAAQPVVVVEGATLAERLEWLRANAANNTIYSIVLTANESILPQALDFQRARNVTVHLRGDGIERVISLPGSGTIFTVGAGVTLVLDSGVTLQGRDQNTASLVIVGERGTLVMNEGARIIDNYARNPGIGGEGTRGSGVRIEAHGVFRMTGGEISGNTIRSDGGAVFVNSNGRFVMTGGMITRNTAGSNSGGGGAVFVRGQGAAFTMSGGEISNNAHTPGGAFCSHFGGGGVNLTGRGATFTMSGGEIFGNRTNGRGGGVRVMDHALFTMSGGEISGNTASGRYGGGVFVGGSGTRQLGIFVKTGGIIYGSAGTDSDNNSAHNGHAVAFGFGRMNGIRNTTAGSTERMNTNTAGAAGGWEN